ncbi:prepilin-type N-terminal cleavage/methylation domain-containing protein [Pseudoalteromonas arctica]|uniref:Prepilin-type N-terminal cleavage/methylation domain-containing protein n=2 Tax=Pseudoalteromonas arctica TaxID=394751 RepID=A0A7Y0DTM6_9GAMM|nr:prepilin-type N-terminal cleavage/methylation domain-containing protein [Pseudoalteromonas arctica]
MKSTKLSFGFTLIELLIVVAILGVLYSVAMPSYIEHMERSRRADIQHVMLQHGVSLERIYSRNGGYPNAFDAALNTEFYMFTYTALNRVTGAATDANFKSRAFMLTATPKVGSAQAGDRCGALVIKHDGTQSADANSCWE